MKIIQIAPRISGERLKDGAYITLGRNYSSASAYGNGIERDGYYIKLDFPFITKRIPYLDPHTFTYTDGPVLCSWLAMMMIRRPRKRIDMGIIDAHEVTDRFEIRKMRYRCFTTSAWQKIEGAH